MWRAGRLMRKAKTQKPPEVQALTFADCDAAYKETMKTFCAYIEQQVQRKFGTYQKAASAIQKTRAQVYNCMTGRAGLDSVRRMALALAAASAEVSPTHGKVLTPFGYEDPY